MDSRKVQFRKKKGAIGKKVSRSARITFYLCQKQERMKFNRTDIEKLLNKIAEETLLDLAHTNFTAIKERLDERYRELYPSKKPVAYSDEYLYRKLYLPAQKPNRQTVSANVAIINAIAQSIGYDSFNHFTRVVDSDDNPVLKNCKGQWYSYVRCNSGQPYILRAPVLIYSEKKIMRMKLQGGVRTFIGNVVADGTCIYCMLKSSEVKNIHMVLKTGLSTRPNVIQGVFSGLSTAGDPIAGREVLVRQEKKFEELSHKRIAIAEMLKSGEHEDRVLARYFDRKESNILKAGTSSTFELGDLEL
jgi:hypothetical protein